jgi:hypothetical protein
MFSIPEYLLRSVQDYLKDKNAREESRHILELKRLSAEIVLLKGDAKLRGLS